MLLAAYIIKNFQSWCQVGTVAHGTKSEESEHKAHSMWTKRRDSDLIAARLTSSRTFSSRATAYGIHTEGIARIALENQLNTSV